MAAGDDGGLYAAGSTASRQFPATPGACTTGVRSDSGTLSNRYSAPPGGHFLMKFPPGETAPAFAALIGAGRQTIPTTLLVDSRGRLTVSEPTLAEALPLRRPLAGSPLPSGCNGVVLQLSPDARDLIFSTYTGSIAAPGLAPGPDGSL